jgi:hypothetical protein
MMACTAVARWPVMRALDIPVAFAFDRDFERAGFQLVGRWRADVQPAALAAIRGRRRPR